MPSEHCTVVTLVVTRACKVTWFMPCPFGVMNVGVRNKQLIAVCWSVVTVKLGLISLGNLVTLEKLPHAKEH